MTPEEENKLIEDKARTEERVKSLDRQIHQLKEELSSSDGRLRSIEQIRAYVLVGGAAFLAFFGYQSIWEIPSTIDTSAQDAITELVREDRENIIAEKLNEEVEAFFERNYGANLLETIESSAAKARISALEIEEASTRTLSLLRSAREETNINERLTKLEDSTRQTEESLGELGARVAGSKLSTIRYGTVGLNGETIRTSRQKWTATKEVSTGIIVYRITFDTPFASDPVVVATPVRELEGRFATVRSRNRDFIEIQIFEKDESVVGDAAFDFVAIEAD